MRAIKQNKTKQINAGTKARVTSSEKVTYTFVLSQAKLLFIVLS